MQILLSVLVVIGVGTPLAAADRARIALVVGNAAYADDARLTNPVNDATDVAAALKKVGWNVVLLADADRRTFNRAVITFRDTLAAQEGADALFYYAGHGVQVEGSNYLIPVKTEFESLEDIKADAISIQSVTDAIQQGKAGVSLVILDACRNNPFEKKSTRSWGGTRGLTVVQTGGGSAGSAIMFSTSPGDVAQDGSGRNGLFTSSLLKYLDSDLRVEDLFKKVTGEVRTLSGGSQNPWINASLSGDVYFISDSTRAARAAEAAKLAEAQKLNEQARIADAARQAEAAKTQAALEAAETARLAAARAQAAQSKAEAEALALQNRPKGKARIESFVTGKVYVGEELLGEIGPDMPLMADGLPPGKLGFRLVVLGKADETKVVTVTDKAYTTVVFGKPAPVATPIVVAATGASDAPAAFWLRRSPDQKAGITVTLTPLAEPDKIKQYKDTDPFPVTIPPGGYTVEARLTDDIASPFVQVYQVGGGGNLIVELPVIDWSRQYRVQRELAALALQKEVLLKRLADGPRNDAAWHGAGWVTAGVGAAVLAFGLGTLIDGFLTKAAYTKATTATRAAALRVRTYWDSTFFSFASVAGGGTLGLSVPMLLAQTSLTATRSELDALETRRLELEAAP